MLMAAAQSSIQIPKAPFRSSVLVWLCVLLCLDIIIINKISCIHTLKQGDSLNSSSQLDSPNGLFTFRFYTFEETNTTYIAVLFNQDDDQVARAVWIGNRDNPIPTNSTPLLTLGTGGDLTITRRRDGGDPILLYGGVSQPLSNVTATLLDTGNLVVVSSNGSTNDQVVLWQSHDHPTDTLLAGMKLGLNNSKITSWLSPTNPATGAFTLEWDPSAGELVIRQRGMAYWRSGDLKSRYDQQVGANVMIFENFNSEEQVPYEFNYNLSSEVVGYFTYRMSRGKKISSGWRLDSEGTLSADVNGGGLILAMASVCYGYNRRGPSVNTIGCELWEQPQCRRGKNQTFVPKSGGFMHKNGNAADELKNHSLSLSLSDCRDTCWRNCGCVGYSSLLGKDYGCSFWIGKDLVWDQDDGGYMERIYVLTSSHKGKKNYTRAVLGVVSVLVLLFILGLAYFIMRNLEAKREEELHQLLTLEGNTESVNRGAKNHHLKLFTYASILSATSHFSTNNKLGEGGFGPVYKGRTAEGQDIAVKLLSRQSGQGLIEFKNELTLISELQHVNLVKLVGFCIHKDEKMIIYDYMPNKSLDCFLFNPSKREQLDWRKRFNIIEGTAQGLLYLHKHSRLRIIHRDMKPNNILLDENMTPKISDFGLARIFKEDTSEANTDRRAGTYGYMAPEYAMQGIFSVKSDVYSFGVLVLEIVSGRRNNSFHEVEGPLSIVEYAWELWGKGCAQELMDPMLKESYIIDQVQKCIHIGLLCVENHAVDRPNIEDVLLMLKNETITLPKPTNPPYITRNSVIQEVEKQSSSNELMKLSANQLTLSQIDGR